MKPIKKNKYGIKEKMVSFINVNILLLLIFSLKFSSSVEVTNKIQSKLLVDLLKASLYKQKPILEANLPTVTTSKQDKNLIENTRNNNLELNKLVIKEKDTLFQCWVKYFHYTSIQDKPNSFFINNKFDKQVASQKNYFEQKDEFGTLNIPDNTSFFAVMQQDKVNILEKRINSSINYIDVLNIELVGRIPDDDPLEGSIKNFGLFEEGFCFRVVSYVPNKYYTMTLTNPDPKGNDSATEFWVFCVNDKEKKEKLMLWIIKSKLHMQSKIGYHEFAKSNEKVDGRWEILKNWGECSMACGGGLQYQQLICILPRNGGKPCEGKNIKSRPCNIHPCPTSTDISSMGNIVHIASPVVKVLPLSTKPIRNELCVIKESDCLMTSYTTNNEIQHTPVRLIMNNSSIVVLNLVQMEANLKNNDAKQNYKTLQTYYLNKTDIKRVNEPNLKEVSLNGKKIKSEQCFMLINPGSKGKFCGIRNPSFAEEWEKDFRIFKNACGLKRKAMKYYTNFDKQNGSVLPATEGLTEKEKKFLKEEYKLKIEQVKKDLIAKKEKEIKSKSQSLEEQKLESKLEDITAKGISTITQEFKVEDLIRKEEENKELTEIDSLKKEISNEEKKKEMLIKKIKDKELEEQFNLKKDNYQKEMDDVNEQTKSKILKKRADIKKKIQMMRKRNERRKELLKSKLKFIRAEVAKELIRVTHTDDYYVCYDEKSQNKKFIDTFCSVNVKDFMPASVLFDCENPATYCSTCCEIKIGEANVKKRDDCYNKCNKLPGVVKTEKQKPEEKEEKSEFDDFESFKL